LWFLTTKPTVYIGWFPWVPSVPKPKDSVSRGSHRWDNLVPKNKMGTPPSWGVFFFFLWFNFEELFTSPKNSIVSGGVPALKRDVFNNVHGPSVDSGAPKNNLRQA